MYILNIAVAYVAVPGRNQNIVLIALPRLKRYSTLLLFKGGADMCCVDVSSIHASTQSL